MRIQRTRPNAVTLVATAQELSAPVSGARIALAVMDADTRAPPQARGLRDLLTRVLADYDAAAVRARDGAAPRASA